MSTAPAPSLIPDPGVSAPKHTAGPWEYRALPDGWGFFPVGATKEDAICGEESDYDPLWSQDPTPENARLIAAAPDLLEACRAAAFELTEAKGVTGQVRDRCRAAIAKATGADQ